MLYNALLTKGQQPHCAPRGRVLFMHIPSHQDFYVVIGHFGKLTVHRKIWLCRVQAVFCMLWMSRAHENEGGAGCDMRCVMRSVFWPNLSTTYQQLSLLFHDKEQSLHWVSLSNQEKISWFETAHCLYFRPSIYVLPWQRKVNSGSAVLLLILLADGHILTASVAITAEYL